MCRRLLVLCLPLALSCGSRPVRVVTQRAGNSRAGAVQESVLTPSAIRGQSGTNGSIHKIFARAVDGQIYGQPLYTTSLAGHAEVVFVATEHNTVFAFDAADPNQGAPIWSVNLGPSAPTPNDDFGNRYGPFGAIAPEIGITSTPVLVENHLYVEAFLAPAPHVYRHLLADIDATTGEVWRTVEIAGQVAGDGAASVNGVIVFDPMQHLQRSALLYANDLIYVAFASYADTDPYHGWVFAYDARTFEQRFVWCDTPDAAPDDGDNAGEGGIWQSGAGPAADEAGNVYLSIGNGSFNAGDQGGRNFGNTLVKLAPGSSQVLDYFTPFDQQSLQLLDLDLGSTGPVLIPGTRLVVTGSKQAKLYVLDRDRLGHYSADGDTQIVQSFSLDATGLFSSPVFFRGATGAFLYVWGQGDYLQAYAFDGQQFAASPTAAGAAYLVDQGYGASLTISADQDRDAVLWATHPLTASGYARPGILRAFDATEFVNGQIVELWNSEQDPADSLGTWSKFNFPLVANGKVFVATFDNQLLAYGFTPPPN